MDPYATLGIERSASPDTIKRSYRKLALQFHPDKNNGAAAARETFESVSQAYKVLSDPHLKARYDRTGHWTDEPCSSPDFFSCAFDIDAIFRGMFAGDDASSSSCRPPPGIVVDVPVRLWEAARGTSKRVEFRVHERCDACDNSIHRHEPCKECGGTGQLRCWISPTHLAVAPCAVCGGRGRLIVKPKNSRCDTCGTTGCVTKVKVLDVRVPGGMAIAYGETRDAHHEVVLPGKGSYSPACDKYGDVTLRFVRDVDTWGRAEVNDDVGKGNTTTYAVDVSGDIHVTIEITLEEVLCGFHKILTIDGERMELKRDGYHTPHEALVLEGRGLPRRTSESGDVVCRFVVRFPQELRVCQRIDKCREVLQSIFSGRTKPGHLYSRNTMM